MASWVALANGAHVTQSPAVIKQSLKTILKDHIFCTLLHEGYQSGKTALVDFTPERLRIDKPTDWPGSHDRVRILFKDGDQLWNQFTVKILSATDDTLYATYPLKQLRLQRRANYRVEVPSGSKAMFMHQDEIFRNFYVQDVSADGVLLYAVSRSSALAEGDTLNDIALTFPSAEKKAPSTYINIRQGRIRRIFHNEQGDTCYGIHFQLTHNEEEVLLQYVRRRERELLRKGIVG